MKEYLSFSHLGQWTLNKAKSSYDDDEPKSDYAPGSKKHKVYVSTTLDGELHEDHGQRGALHGGGKGGQKRSAVSRAAIAGKVPHEQESAYNERNPGVGN